MNYCNLQFKNFKLNTLKSMSEVTISLNHSNDEFKELTIRNKENIVFLIIPMHKEILSYDQLTTEDLIKEYNRIMSSLDKIKVINLNVIPYEEKFTKPKLRDVFKEEIDLIDNIFRTYNFETEDLPYSLLYNKLNKEYGDKFNKSSKELTIPQLIYYGKFKEKGFLTIEIKCITKEYNMEKHIRYITKKILHLSEDYIKSENFIEEIKKEFKKFYPLDEIKSIQYLNKTIHETKTLSDNEVNNSSEN